MAQDLSIVLFLDRHADDALARKACVANPAAIRDELHVALARLGDPEEEAGSLRGPLSGFCVTSLLTSERGLAA